MNHSLKEMLLKTREEEIAEVARKNYGSFWEESAFVKGAHWADQNPVLNQMYADSKRINELQEELSQALLKIKELEQQKKDLVILRALTD